MPHIRLTVSRNAATSSDFSWLLPTLVELLCRFETIDPTAVKAYADVREHWAMGVGAPAGFVHCEVSLLTGRSQELRSRISEAFVVELERWFHTLVVTREVGVGVEVREMDAATYRKVKKP
jgi:5-carboxymethyl-2-hydroxymuconate isomerase